jgi:hypothetical protein
MTPTPPASGLSVERIAELRMRIASGSAPGIGERNDLLALLDARLGEAQRDHEERKLADLVGDARGMMADYREAHAAEKAKCNHMGCVVNATVGSPTGECTRCGGTVVLPTLPSPVPAAEAEVVGALRRMQGCSVDSNAVHWLDRAIALLSASSGEDAAMLDRLSDNSWQPISTAPRDGSVVMLYWPTLSITNYPAVGFHHGDEYGWSLQDRDYGEVIPTHWRPLPAPPPIPTPTEPGAV